MAKIAQTENDKHKKNKTRKFIYFSVLPRSAIPGNAHLDGSARDTKRGRGLVVSLQPGDVKLVPDIYLTVPGFSRRHTTRYDEFFAADALRRIWPVSKAGPPRSVPPFFLSLKKKKATKSNFNFPGRNRELGHQVCCASRSAVEESLSCGVSVLVGCSFSETLQASVNRFLVRGVAQSTARSELSLLSSRKIK